MCLFYVLALRMKIIFFHLKMWPYEIIYFHSKVNLSIVVCCSRYLQAQQLSSPVCNATSLGGSCSPPQSQCHTQHWTATLRIWDAAGVRSVQVEGGAVVPHQADGQAESATFSSDCCLQQAKVVVTNLLGEKYRCRVTAPPHVPRRAVAVPPDVSGKAVAATTAWLWCILMTFVVIHRVGHHGPVWEELLM